jgi:hypothetical protein
MAQKRSKIETMSERLIPNNVSPEGLFRADQLATI